MTVEKITAVVHLLALLAAIGSMAFVLYHCWGAISHLRPDRSLLANLLGAFALLPGSLYDAEGLRHRASMVLWLAVCAVAALVALATRFFLDGAGGS
jgi:hypothetical protein